MQAYGHTYKLSASNTVVIDLRPIDGYTNATLRGINELKGRSSFFYKLAVRECGQATADRSWLAIVNFPDAPGAALAYRFAFFARTAAGWRLWYHGTPS